MSVLRQPLPIDDVELIGGHPAVDLVNTVAWRSVPERRLDRLASARDLAVLARRTGVAGSLPPAAVEDGDDALARAVELREVLHPWFTARARGREVDEETRRAAAGPLRAALGRAVPARGGRLRWSVEVRGIDDVPAALALAACELLQSDELERISECEREGCGWLFLDRSRNHSRRWCSSEDCGNVVRARRHYARRRDAAGA